MNSIQEAMLNLKKMSLGTKFDTACKQLAAKNGVDATNDQAMDAFLEQNVGIHLEGLAHQIPQGMAAKLEGFRKSVGEDMWATIAQNPSLPQLVETWFQDHGKRVIYDLIAKLQDFLKDTEITAEEVEQYVLLQVGG